MNQRSYDIQMRVSDSVVVDSQFKSIANPFLGKSFEPCPARLKKEQNDAMHIRHIGCGAQSLLDSLAVTFEHRSYALDE